MSDWLGNKRTTFATLGASSHANHERQEHDYYATPSRAGEDLIKKCPYIKDVWECAFGQGHLAKGLGNIVIKKTDLIARPHFETGELNETFDFLQAKEKWKGWIVTNPPFKYAKEFAMIGNEIADGVALFLRIQFLESQTRQELFKKYPPKYIYVYAKRCPQCCINGQFGVFKTGNASTYAWFIWEKGYTGEPVVRWI